LLRQRSQRGRETQQAAYGSGFCQPPDAGFGKDCFHNLTAFCLFVMLSGVGYVGGKI
jgi:hypothetical protein